MRIFSYLYCPTNMNPTMTERMTIVFAVNDSYAQHLCVAMVSVLENHPGRAFDFYVLTDFVSDANRSLLREAAARYGGDHRVEFLSVGNEPFERFANNIAHITRHTYYRFLIPELLPDTARALYLDADLVVDGDLSELWRMPLGGALCAGVRDLYVERLGYKPRIGLTPDDLYVNAGVLLMDLDAMRREGATALLMRTAAERSAGFEFQDQDVLNVALRGRIREVPAKWNYASDNAAAGRNAAAEKPVIVHYTGRVKPWSVWEKSRNPLRGLYFRYLKKTPAAYRRFVRSFRRGRLLRRLHRWGLPVCGAPPRPIRVALVIDEYFGGMGTAYGGYGFLARNYVARYLPDEEIEVEVLLARNRKRWAAGARSERIDGVKVIVPPGKKFVKGWLRRQNYDCYLTIELTHDILKFERRRKPVIHWVQDPRPWPEWREIETVKLFPESCYWCSELYDLVNRLYYAGQVRFVSQGRFLDEKARMLYRLPAGTPIEYLPNPVDIDYGFDPATYEKKNHVIFIGRIESVKRGWLFCEIARQMPQYEFFMLGQTFREKGRNETVMARYREGIPNLHFVGHVEGEEKERYIREAKILVNTSIHEALPVTFLEALAYGTLLVSCRNPEELTSRFGEFVGTVLGDGFDRVPDFVAAVERLMTDEERRRRLSCEAVRYIRDVHSVHNFQRDMRRTVKEAVGRV